MIPEEDIDELEERFCTRARCSEVHRKVDLDLADHLARLAVHGVRYDGLENWMGRIEKKQNWTLTTLVGLLVTIISGMLGIIYILLQWLPLGG